MKILKIFGIVVGIHVFALVLIFANPGCSSSTKPPPAPVDTVATPPPSINVPNTPSGGYGDPAPAVTFNPDAPATSPSGAGVRYTPTRPGTPAAGTLVAEPVVDVTPATTYAVKAGDSLWTIAKKHKLTVAQLAAANSLSTNSILRPNQKLLIPGKPASPTAAATADPALAQGKTAQTIAPRPAPAKGGTVRHTVRSGETLGAIARTYGVRSGDIAVANNIADPAKIRAGMELIIPGWETPGGKAARSTAPAKSSTAAAAAAPKPAPASPPTIQVDTPPPAQDQTPEVPVIRIDEGPSPIQPAPKEP
jgi:LysM repeat protein